MIELYDGNLFRTVFQYFLRIKGEIRHLFQRVNPELAQELIRGAKQRRVTNDVFATDFDDEAELLQLGDRIVATDAAHALDI